MRKRISLYITLVALTGCGLLSAPKEIALNERLPQPEAKQVINKLQQQASTVRSARLLYNTVVRHHVGKEKLKQAVVFQRPDQVRVEFFQPGLNQTASLIVSSGDSLQAYNAKEKVVAVGKSTANNFKRLLHVPFLPEELILWLSGRFAPLMPGTSYRVHQSDNGFALWISTPDKRTMLCEFAAEGERLRLIALEIYGNNASHRLFRSNLSYTSGGEFPDSIEFWLAEDDLAGTMTLESSTLNPSLEATADRLFNIPLRSGTKVRELN